MKLENTKTVEKLGIGPRLKQYREAAGLSVNEIADAIGYSRSGIEKMERGDANPTALSLFLYLRACGRTLGELFRSLNARKSA
jgi:transcriptional regulator with XRE-family HTH domain